MESPTLPIVIADGLDIGLFKSTGAAERALEATDVAAHRYEGFDAIGRLLTLAVRPPAATGEFAVAATVSIALAEERPSNPDRLHAILVSYLRAVEPTPYGTDRALETQSLSHILEFVQRTTRIE